MNCIKIKIKLINNEYSVIFTEETSEKNNSCLEYIKNKIIEIISILLTDDYINFEDLLTFNFEISSQNKLKPKVLKYQDKKLFACYSIDRLSGDKDVNYFWSIPFDKSINKKIISIFEGQAGNYKNTIKSIMSDYGYDFNSMIFTISSSKN